MRLLDLYCGAGGASAGYARAGWEVVGIDIAAQPSYPYEFIKLDALEALRLLDLSSFDAIHASPPCQAYSSTSTLGRGKHPRLIEPTREALLAIGKPYVIENVVGAPLRYPIMLCGSMFGLDVKRHRLFEVTFPTRPRRCRHGSWKNRYPTHARKDKAQTSPVVHVYGTGGGAGKDLDLWRRVMETPWMQSKAEVAESIPPAYTEFVGAALADSLAR